ncbi:carbohydrate kinase family protein [Gorillibacterium sp. sgz5001074]|uniref:carbohydrate kinase family protein n=1 Tax=Gorillibacterium sp. sgz5001074 TaxID=3446695 RepID=UPI003F68090B
MSGASVIYTIGEALIDFIPDRKGVRLKEVDGFRKAAGGAPANVACAVAKLGGRSAFIGMLGRDAFGDFLLETLEEAGVDTRYTHRTGDALTTLAFVSLQEDGNRDFSFYRNPGADMLLSEEHVADIPFGPGDILHFCSVDLIDAPVKEAHRLAVRRMAEAGGTVSFDPNVRLPLWPSPEACRAAILEFLPFSHIVKVSDEELAFITGIEDDEERALASLFTGAVKQVLYTKGAAGSVWVSRDATVEVSGRQVEAVDTTGAGDAFVGAVLYRLRAAQGLGPEAWTPEQARELLAFANAAAALSTTRPGAIASFPGPDEVRG